MAVIDIEIVARLRIEFARQRDLGVVLAQMRLDVAIGEFPRQRAGRLELLGRGGDREARRDGVVETALAMPAGDQGLALVVAALRRIGEGGRRVAVQRRGIARGALRESGGTESGHGQRGKDGITYRTHEHSPKYNGSYVNPPRPGSSANHLAEK